VQALLTTWSRALIGTITQIGFVAVESSKARSTSQEPRPNPAQRCSFQDVVTQTVHKALFILKKTQWSGHQSLTGPCKSTTPWVVTRLFTRPSSISTHQASTLSTGSIMILRCTSFILQRAELQAQWSAFSSIVRQEALLLISYCRIFSHNTRQQLVTTLKVPSS